MHALIHWILAPDKQIFLNHEGNNLVDLFYFNDRKIRNDRGNWGQAVSDMEVIYFGSLKHSPNLSDSSGMGLLNFMYWTCNFMFSKVISNKYFPQIAFYTSLLCPYFCVSLEKVKSMGKLSV